MKTLVNLYGVLGVEPSADPLALRRAYRKLARKHHPDVSSDPKSHDLMARINEAFETLIDPDRRTEYDTMLSNGLLDEPETPRRVAKKPVTVRLSHRVKVHNTPIYGLGFTPDGQLVSGSFDNEIVWMNPRSTALLRRIKLEGSALSVIHPMPGDRLVVAGSAENQISVWHLDEGRIRSWKNPAYEWVSCMAVSRDGTALATGSIHRGLSVWDSTTGQTRYVRSDHTASVTAVAWSNDGRFLATGSADASMKLRHAPNGAVLHTFGGVRSAVTAAAFSPDNQFLAVASVDYSVRVFRLADGYLQKVMFGHQKPIEAIAFHPNGWLFATGARDGQVQLWNAAEGIGQLELAASNLPISCLAFSPDGGTLAAGGLDKMVRLWGIEVRSNA